jgi:hypothetical protein
MVTTKIYQNNGSETVNIIGVGEIPAGETLSVTSEYHQPVVMANYPDVVELVDEEAKADQSTATETQAQQETQNEETV